jgi:glycosyltransferase involved in cell wall biosynthesis
MLPSISIITVVYNGAEHLEEAIQSVIEQKYPNLEYIVVDGGSVDGSLDIIKRHAERGDISKFVSEPDRGIAAAFNKGIAMSSGEIVGMINSDDSYFPGALGKVAEAYGRIGPDSILHGNIVRGRGHKQVRIRPRPLPAIWKYVDSPFNHPATFVPRRIYETVGLYDERYRFAMDYDFYVRALLKGVKFYFLDEDLAYFSASGSSSAAPLSCHREVLASQKANGLFSPVCYLTYSLKVLVNYAKRAFQHGHGTALHNSPLL